VRLEVGQQWNVVENGIPKDFKDLNDFKDLKKIVELVLKLKT